MKELKSIKLSTLFAGLLGILVSFSTVNAQEYDDLYFNKSDRKTVKSESKATLAKDAKSLSGTDYNQATKSTEVYSAKNVNPEYVARYKSSESNEVRENTIPDSEYGSDDYFIEDYNTPDSTIGIHQNEIDYAALNKRDQMSYSNYDHNHSNPYWRMNPYMSMGYGSPYYDPFMMGYSPGFSMGMGYGFGTGFYPSMSYSMAMSWGTGYNPWSSWGGYPYSPYGMRGYYDPWAYGYGYSPYMSGYGYGLNSYGYYGYSRPYYVVSTSNSEYYNDRNISYKPRSTSRSNSIQRASTASATNSRVSASDSKIRIPSRAVTSESTSNGRVSRDYSKSQNEYYNTNRRSTSSSERIAASTSSRNTYARTSSSSSSFTNRPSRTSNSSSGYNSPSNSRSYSSNSGSRSSSSYSSPGRSSSSFGGGNSYSSGSSSGRSSSYSSAGRSSSSGSSSGRSSSSSGSSRSGGRQ
jgi:hypothetical protein